MSRVSPALQGEPRTEGYLTQPMLRASWQPRASGLGAHLTVNFEALTLRRGELGPGIYGEGYIDRRHPHTTLHEIVLGATGSAGPIDWSLTAGKGFVPFGSDDPMSRPFVKYPVNHHLAQVIERALGAAALRFGSAAVEYALFNGDEPERPNDRPNSDRVGDSWSARATAWPLAGLELTASTARVKSPEDAGGFGLEHRKRHVGARFERGQAYLMVETTRTDEYSGRRHAFRFASTLAEGSVTAGGITSALRFERTTRPDEQRIGNLFRSPRPLLDFSIEGRSRWDVISLGLSRSHAGSRFSASPFVEVQLAHVRPTLVPSVFVPREFYGASRIRTVSAGVRLRAGSGHGRVGRYGVAQEARQLAGNSAAEGGSRR